MTKTNCFYVAWLHRQIDVDRCLVLAVFLVVTYLSDAHRCMGGDLRIEYEREQIVRALQAGLSSEQPEVRRSAAFSLGELGEASLVAIPDLIDALKDDKVSYSARDALVKIGPRCVRPLLRTFSESTHVGQHREIAVAVGEIRPSSEEGATFLSDLLKDANENVRLAAVMGLWDYGAKMKVALPGLMEALDDSNSEVVEWSLTAIQYLKQDAASAEEVVTAVLTKEPNVRIGQNAADALGAMHASSPDAISALAFAVSKKNISAAKALGEIGAEAADAVDELSVALASGERHLIVAAADALGRIRQRPEIAVPALAKIAKEGNSDEYSNEFVPSLKALVEYGADADLAMPDMVELLEDKSASRRFYAARVLGKIGPSAKPAVGKLLQMHLWDEDESIRDECERALKRIQSATKTSTN
jgi:HEAT repeat protein